MVTTPTTPSGHEIFFPEDQFIVSKTDLKGKITYTNILFEEMSGLTREELLGQPHNIIRHPEMPRSIFNLFWETLQQQKEIFAYVKNMHKNGSHYWVLAHVVPSYDIQANHVGYHSTRRFPKREIVQQIEAFYGELLEIERRHSNPKDGIEAATVHLNNFLDRNHTTYAEHIFALSKAA